VVPSSPNRPAGADADRVDDAVGAALAHLGGDEVADPGSRATRRVLTVLDAIAAARAGR
jgi:hypothetical protein